MKGLDTNVLVRYLTQDDPEQSRKANALLQARYGVSFNGNSARAFTGILTLADAINRAGSTRPEAIQKALRETNLPGDQLIMTWEGVRFDQTGQNTGVKGIILQLQGGQYHTVYPFEVATREVIYPIPQWKDRK